MITSNDMQLKAIINKKAKQWNITPQASLQIYCLERLLDRIAKSQNNDCFIIKGGFLIASLIGIEHRSTMDIDTTIKGFSLTKENIKDIFNDICNIEIEDQLTFILDRVEDIRETDDYPGIRVYIFAEYGKIKTPLTVDVTTGDSIIPKEINYTYKCVFDDDEISILAYPIENILAEKIETVISRSIANTRPRDFYDIHVLYSIKKDEINWKNLKFALLATSTKRGSLEIINNYKQILDKIKTDKTLNNFWQRFSVKNNFAKEITFINTINSIEECLKKMHL